METSGAGASDARRRRKQTHTYEKGTKTSLTPGIRAYSFFAVSVPPFPPWFS